MTHAATILAIDPGRVSGIATWSPSRIWDYGIAIKPDTRASTVSNAHSIAEREHLPLVVVIEKHTIRGKWGTQAMAGLSENVGAWKELVAQLPRRRPTTKVIRVDRSEWRRKLFGRNPNREQAHQMAIARATERWPVHCSSLSHDEAEALCILEWATEAEAVGKLPGVERGSGNPRVEVEVSEANQQEGT